MNLIHHKLRSRTGASLSIALLLFLVCLAVASVVLTAGTAASGRLSELREADQRYYSVTSAAELVRDMIGDQTVTFTQTKTIKVTEKKDDDGNVISTSTKTTYATSWNKDVLIENATVKLIFGGEADNLVNSEAAWLLSGADTDSLSGDTFPLFTITPSNSNALPVDVKAVWENGDLVFYFKNQKTDTNDEVFCLMMTCTPGAPRPEAAAVTSSNDTTTVLTRNVNVEWKKANCIIERTGAW